MNEEILRQSKILVERTVRPVVASLDRKRRMREELLAHLEMAFEEELRLEEDPQHAWDRSKQRFGDPKEVSADLQQSVSRFARLAVGWGEKLNRKPGEPAWRFALKHLAATYSAYLLGLPVFLYRVFVDLGSFGYLVSILWILFVIATVSAIVSFVIVLSVDTISRALYGIDSERNRMKGLGYCIASAGIFPGMFFLIYGILALPSPQMIGYWGIIGLCGVSTPLLFLLISRGMAKELRYAEEWSSLDISDA